MATRLEEQPQRSGEAQSLIDAPSIDRPSECAAEVVELCRERLQPLLKARPVQVRLCELG